MPTKDLKSAESLPRDCFSCRHSMALTIRIMTLSLRTQLNPKQKQKCLPVLYHRLMALFSLLYPILQQGYSPIQPAEQPHQREDEASTRSGFDAGR